MEINRHGLQGHQLLPKDQMRALIKKIISIHPKYYIGV